MTQETSSAGPSRTEAQRNLIVRMIRISGGTFIFAGLMVFFNIGGLGDMLGGTDAGTNKIVGGALMFVGLMDVIWVPRILEQVLKK